MLDSFDMIQDANSPRRILSPKKSPESQCEANNEIPIIEGSALTKEQKTRSPRSSGKKKKKLSRSNKKRSPKNDNAETSEIAKTKPTAQSVIQKLGKEKTAEVLTDMILKDLAKDVSSTMLNEQKRLVKSMLNKLEIRAFYHQIIMTRFIQMMVDLTLSKRVWMSKTKAILAWEYPGWRRRHCFE